MVVGTAEIRSSVLVIHEWKLKVREVVSYVLAVRRYVLISLLGMPPFH